MAPVLISRCPRAKVTVPVDVIDSGSCSIGLEGFSVCAAASSRVVATVEVNAVVSPSSCGSGLKRWGNHVLVSLYA